MINTNLNKTREQIIYKLLISLNKGNCGGYDGRVDKAIVQYQQLIDRGIIGEKR